MSSKLEVLVSQVNDRSPRRGSKAARGPESPESDVCLSVYCTAFVKQDYNAPGQRS